MYLYIHTYGIYIYIYMYTDMSMHMYINALYHLFMAKIGDILLLSSAAGTKGGGEAAPKRAWEDPSDRTGAAGSTCEQWGFTVDGCETHHRKDGWNMRTPLEMSSGASTRSWNMFFGILFLEMGCLPCIKLVIRILQPSTGCSEDFLTGPKSMISLNFDMILYWFYPVPLKVWLSSMICSRDLYHWGTVMFQHTGFVGI